MKRYSGNCIALLMLTGSLPGLAQENTPQLEEVRVLGERIVRNLLETNTSVNVMTAEDIARTRSLNIQQIFRQAANIAPTGTGIQSFDFAIRGINTDGVGGAGQEGLASIIIDGATTTRVQNARGITGLFDVERVEILRGPQATNRGKSSLAGAVVVQTKDPKFERETYLRGEYADYNSYQTALAHTGPINNEWAYRVVLDYQHTDGFLDNKARNEDDYLESDTTTARMKLLYQPTDADWRALLSYTRLEGDTNNDIESYDVKNRDFESYNPYDSQMESDQDLATLHLDYDLSDQWSLRSISTYNQFDSDDRNNAFAITEPTDEEAWKANIDQEEFTQELRADYSSDKITGVVGVYYADYEEENLRDGIGIVGFEIPGLGVGNVHVVFDSPADIETLALFTEADYRVNERLTITAGFRWEDLKYDLASSGLITAFIDALPWVGIPINDLTMEGDKNQDVFLPKLAANYALAENQHIGITYSEAYRPGGVDLDIFNGEVTEYDSEYTKNYELSYKSLWLNNQLSVNANLFYIDWDDMQTSGSEDIRSGTYNAGESTVWGGEAELRWTGESLDTYFSAGYSNTEFDEFVSAGGDNDFSGNEFANSPKYTLALGGSYYIGDLTLTAEASYRDEYYDSITNDYTVEDLTLVNVSASYRWDQAELRLFVNNVFDEINTIRRPTITEGIELSPQTDPRVVGMRVSYAF